MDSGFLRDSCQSARELGASSGWPRTGQPSASCSPPFADIVAGARRIVGPLPEGVADGFAETARFWKTRR